MSFREKSAWLMGVALLAAGAFYFYVVAQMSEAVGAVAPPVTPFIVVYVIALTVIAVFGHIVIAVLAPKDAQAKRDERDRAVLFAASNRSGYVFATGTVLALGYYLFTRDGDALFHAVFASLMLGQIVEYALQIYFYRRAV